jgi:glycosyltransferase involved in cell wall biosynthesis
MAETTTRERRVISHQLAVNDSITIAICTYNGAQRLPQVLDRLRSQVRVESIVWEVIVTDNNSTDNTAAVVERYRETYWQQNASLKYVFEPRQGLAFARQRSVEEASGTWVAFLDDDNLPAEDWVAAAYNFGKSHPQAGAYSGQIHGKFDSVPPTLSPLVASMLALQDDGDRQCQFNPDILKLPPGAGLVVRQQAWQESTPDRPFLIGRVKGAMLSGEDFEMLLHMHRLGWEIWYEPQMQMEHHIPQARLELSYLRHLARGCGLVMCHLWMMRAATWQKPWVFLKTLLGNLRWAIALRLKYRSQLETDAVAAAELEFFRSATASSFFYLWYWWQWKFKQL